MFLGSDDTSKKLSDETIARRGVELYNVCEEAFDERCEKYPNSLHPVYVIGSEVPIPGGEYEEKDDLEVTSPQDFEKTIETYDIMFKEYGFKNAWDNIIAVVVQPGVEFSNEDIHEYNRDNATPLCEKLIEYPNLVFEGHSTDYQTEIKLKEMVEDGVAVLKVGPALTYALREGLFSLSLIERELIIDESKRANFIEFLDEIMRNNPKYWEKYYDGDKFEKELQRKYSFSDRCRYYMSRQDINENINKLFENIDSNNTPLGMIRQYFPQTFLKIKSQNSLSAKNLVKLNIINVLEDYNYAIEK